jgi:hypothetical protein
MWCDLNEKRKGNRILKPANDRADGTPDASDYRPQRWSSALFVTDVAQCVIDAVTAKPPMFDVILVHSC